jgi:hypothetical protein
MFDSKPCLVLKSSLHSPLIELVREEARHEYRGCNAI